MWSFALPPGLKYSTLASTVVGRASVTLDSQTRGVLSLVCRTFSKYFVELHLSGNREGHAWDVRSA